MAFPIYLIRMAAIGCLVSLAAACNTTSPRSLTVATGKVVYGTMAMEGAEIKVLKVEGEKWKVVEESRSGYHGSFRLHLGEGTYRIEASTTITMGDSEVNLTGAIEPIIIKGTRGRMDQVVIKLKAGS